MIIESIQRYNWEGKTVLIVEEDTSSLFFLKEILGFTRTGILEAQTGEDAIFLVKKHRNIDMVLIDIGISCSDGYDVVRRIKSLKKDLPVIVQTTHTLPEDRENCYRAGCDAFVAKPIDTFELLWKIDHFMSGDADTGDPERIEYLRKKSDAEKRNP